MKEHSRILCDKRGRTILKGKFCRTSTKPTRPCKSSCWIVNRQHIQQMNLAEMRKLKWISGNIFKTGIRKEIIRDKLEITPREDKIKWTRLR